MFALSGDTRSAQEIFNRVNDQGRLKHNAKVKHLNGLGDGTSTGVHHHQLQRLIILPDTNCGPDSQKKSSRAAKLDVSPGPRVRVIYRNTGLPLEPPKTEASMRKVGRPQ